MIIYLILFLGLLNSALLLGGGYAHHRGAIPGKRDD